MKKKYTQKEVVELFNEYANSRYYDVNGIDLFLKEKGLIEEKQELEVGKWYRFDDDVFLYRGIASGNLAFQWVCGKPIYFTRNSNFTTATKEEVEEALKTEFEKRCGKPIRNVTYFYDDVYNIFWVEGFCVMKDGKWEEIVDEETDNFKGNIIQRLENIEKKLGI